MKVLFRISLLLVLTVLIFPLLAIPVSAAGVNDYVYYRNVSCNNTGITENLTDFKVVLRLNSTNFDFTKCKADGSDIYFTGSDGSRLDFERIWDSTNQTAELWIKVPAIVQNTTSSYFKFFYGSSFATDQEATPWGSNYVLVAHMNNYPNNSYTPDSANLGGFYKNSTNEPAEVTALINKALDFDGSNDWILGPNPDTTIYSLETAPYTITGNLFQAIITSDGNVAYTTRTGSTDANVGIAEYDIETKSLSFSKHLAAWTSAGGGPESISKFANGNYLTSDCDSGVNVYEIEPDGDIVWTYDSGQVGTLCRVITMDGVEYLLVEYTQSGHDHYVKILNRSDRSEVWSWDADTFPNDADYRLTATGKKVAVADYLDHTLKVIDYDTKATAWAYNVTGLTDYGPFNVNFIDDTHLLYSEGDTGYVKVIDISDNSIDWTSKVFQTTTRGVRLWGTDKAVITNGSAIYVCDITTAPADLTTLSVSAIITPDTVSGYQYIVGHGSGGGGTGYNLYLDDYLLSFGCSNSTGTAKYIQSSAHLSANTTYSVRCILTGGYLKLYINGALDAATAVACAEIKKTTYNILIGSDASHTANFFNGKMDEVRIEKRAPTVTELAAEEKQLANTYLILTTQTVNPAYVEPVTPSSPLSAYFGAQTIILILPGLLLLGLILMCSFIGFKQIREGQIISALTIFLLEFILVGVILLVGMPILLDGINSTIFYK